MSRLLVVSRNMSVAIALASDDHDVVEIRPDVAESWRAELADVDAAVLDLGGPLAAAATIRGMRKEGLRLPVMFARNADLGWDRLEAAHLPAVGFVRLPLLRKTLLDTVRSLLASGSAPAQASIAPDSSSANEGPDAPDETRRQSPEPVVTPPALVGPPVVVAQPASGAPSGLTEPAFPGPPETTLRRLAPRPPLPQAITDHSTVAKPFIRKLPPRPTVTRRGPSQTSEDLVRTLLTRAADFVGVRETAEVVLAEARERTSAEAGCVMLPDGEAWRVAASHGMRPLEQRLELSATHWLIAEVIELQHGILVMDSDIVRSRLANAPLAHWRHLMAVPIANVQGVILLAREHPAFDQRGLQAVIGVAAEADPLIASALDLRRLARALVDYTDDA